MTARLTSDALIRIVQRAPDGLTSSDVAAVLPGVSVERVTSVLSRLASYGLIVREYRSGRENGMPRRWCIWKAKEAASA